MVVQETEKILPVNRILAITIPTFNRCHVLKENLNYLIRLVSNYQIPIYVSDNNSSDDTVAMVANAIERYPFIFLHKNRTNIGMDANFHVALSLPNSEYMWIIGDDDLVSEGQFERIYKILGTLQYQLVVLNGGAMKSMGGRVTGVKSKVFNNPGTLMQEIGWHMTWISCLIISRDFHRDLKFEKYIGSYFSHFGAIFEALSRNPTVIVYWYDPSSFYPSPNAKFSWSSRVLEIFSEKWTKIVLSLPSTYSDEIKTKCIVDHGHKSGLLSFSGFLNLRAQGGISFSLIRSFADSLRRATKVNLIVVYLIALLPIYPLRIVRYIYITMRGLSKP